MAPNNKERRATITGIQAGVVKLGMFLSAFLYALVLVLLATTTGTTQQIIAKNLALLIGGSSIPFGGSVLYEKYFKGK